MTASTTTPRPSDEALREAVSKVLGEMLGVRPFFSDDLADALLAGPFRPILDTNDDLHRRIAELEGENDHLRASLANSGGPCAYCELPREEWSKCAEGFPGCGRGDDAMLCPHVGASMEAEDRATAAEARAAWIDAVLTKVIRPSAIKLMAGEMTAQEARTAYAVANGIAAKVRQTLAEGDRNAEHG